MKIWKHLIFIKIGILSSARENECAKLVLAVVEKWITGHQRLQQQQQQTFPSRMMPTTANDKRTVKCMIDDKLVWRAIEVCQLFLFSSHSNHNHVELFGECLLCAIKAKYQEFQNRNNDNIVRISIEIFKIISLYEKIFLEIILGNRFIAIVK